MSIRFAWNYINPIKFSALVHFERAVGYKNLFYVDDKDVEFRNMFPNALRMGFGAELMLESLDTQV
ncbi:hypothetical protein C5167_016463 [Papaver somniferum]|nr:hypothetical protein C5167_016463 [Papaver somniferum]